jgi:hypothetical protein
VEFDEVRVRVQHTQNTLSQEATIEHMQRQVNNDREFAQ